MIPTDGWRSISEGSAPLPTVIEELRNSAADGYYTNAGESSAAQNAPATSSATDRMQVDYDEENPTLPGNPIFDQHSAGASQAQESLMVNEIGDAYAALRDPVCNACHSRYAAGMVTCPTCDAVQDTQLNPAEEQIAIQDAVTTSRAEFSLAWTEDHAYRGVRITGSHADLLRKGQRYLRARVATDNCMASPNDGNDPWPS